MTEHYYFNAIVNITIALPTTQPSSLKRNAPYEFDHDSENIDPSIFMSPNKKSKNINIDFAKPNKASHFILTNASTTSAMNRPIITPARLQKSKAEVPSTPIIPDRLPKSRRTGASSAPTAAGRSPKNKRIGILSRRRVSSSPFTRVDPPSFSKDTARGGVPFSLDAALSSIAPPHKPPQPVEVPTLEESTPKSWMFDIYEDTKQEEAGNLMNHYTCTLDISSDDESRAAAKDDRGKENIPPVDGLAYSSATVAFTRADMMTDEPRTPLGALNAMDFYAEGCDASSYIVIPAEKDVDGSNEKVATAVESQEASLTPPQSTEAKVETAPGWEEFLEQVEQSREDMKDVNECLAVMQQPSNQPNIEIWESESAKGDNDTTSQDFSRSTTPIRSLEPEITIPDFADDVRHATLA